jgi:spermidine synthase
VPVKKSVAAQSSEALSLLQRRYLYCTAAITGAAIMIVEILGAKMLAPYIGTSHFVWTAQIAVTLVALAAGYYAGGRLVDRSPQPGPLYLWITVAAAYLCLAVLVVEPVAYWCLKFSLPIGSLLASAFLFFIPLSLLAMVGPFFVRLLTVAVAGVGGSVGRLTAISTIGSFIGTILIGYVLIPFLSNSLTMFLTAAVLMAISAAYLFVWSRKGRAVLLLISAAGLGLGFAGVHADQHKNFGTMEELQRRNSYFGLLQVLQQREGTRRIYLNDYLTQNTYDTRQKKSISMFTYMLYGLSRAYTPALEDVLCIGLGIGIVPRQLAQDGSRVDVVEINPAVVPIAERYFDLEPKRLNIHYGDGRFFVNQSQPAKYDAIILDAFLGDSCPSHLMTREAFTAMRRILKPQGVLVINTFCELDPTEEDFFGASLSKTLASVFPSVRIHNAGDSGNTFFVASSQTNLAIIRPMDFSAIPTVGSCLSSSQAAYVGLRETDPNHGRILTDDFNPVEFYDARNRERIRRNLALSIKELQGPGG